MERCRFCNCMKSREFCENIFDNKQTNPTIPTIVELFTNLKTVENDPYTKFICFDCFHILIIFYHYRERVLETNQLLRNEIENKQNNIEDFHKKWPRIEESVDGQFVVYKNDSDNGCKMNLQIGNDSKVIENQCIAESFGFIKNEVDIGETCLKIENDFNDDDEQKIYENNHHLSIPVGDYDDNQLNDNNDFDRYCSVVRKDESTIEEYPSIIGSDSNDEDSQPLSTFIGDDKKETSNNNNNNENINNKIVLNEQQTGNQCNICCKKFTTRTDLKNHILRIHTDGEVYQCNICDKKISNTLSLKNHILRHTKEKRYKCNICSMFFTSKSNLSLHLITHTGVKAHQCNICNKRFGRNSGLKEHLRVHTGEKPYKCNICNNRYRHTSSLKKHLNLHTNERPHQCHICKKNYSEKGYLKEHLKIHSDERPHQCNHCDKKFTRKPTLKKHLIVHTSEKPYQCGICNKRLKHKKSLKIHLLQHTDEKP